MLFGFGSMSMRVLVETNVRNKWSIVKVFYNLKGGFACLHLCDVWMEQKALLWCIINYTIPNRMITILRGPIAKHIVDDG